ncbi:YicC family protein [Pseudotabrizicola sediminis]|uniref:YicC family protein n=1 Tax=Pseudotabrizicola sediminis TaxID=2486418 RepID=A0ABY2KV97_9RHOB|nr:YicC/YloC family endoribonuclease [Pseudotabrizicola sediminis]TGD45492.1 YicC family protein [Pseudotabrizicola sediminis]
MTVSMTGFAARKGQGAGFVWVWDIRSVNGKGLDLRLRLPDWVDGLELAVRTQVQKALSRGTVSLSVKVAAEGAEAGAGLQVNTPVLAAVLAAVQQVENAAMQAGVTLAQATAADVLAVRGVLETASAEADTAPLRAALLADLPALLAEFTEMRAAEGAAMHGVIAAQLDQIDALTRAAITEADLRRDAAAGALRAALARVLDHAEGADEGRVAQELALIAVKQDVTEELDRLTAHVAAARALLADAGPVGRKFDFLMQEFMREANTLCSKAQSLALTRIGLDLKTVIDQMREQVQNVE